MHPGDLSLPEVIVAGVFAIKQFMKGVFDRLQFTIFHDGLKLLKPIDITVHRYPPSILAEAVHFSGCRDEVVRIIHPREQAILKVFFLTSCIALKRCFTDLKSSCWCLFVVMLSFLFKDFFNVR